MQIEFPSDAMASYSPWKRDACSPECAVVICGERDKALKDREALHQRWLDSQRVSRPEAGAPRKSWWRIL
jgi:hypothetical protein